MEMAEMIERVLEQSLGKTVLIKLSGGKTLRGTLEGFDQHVNLVLKEAENIFARMKSEPDRSLASGRGSTYLAEVSYERGDYAEGGRLIDEAISAT